MGRRWLDRALIAAAVVLVALILGDAISSRSHHGRRAVVSVRQQPGPAPVVSARVSLHASPETTFLPTCAFARLRVTVRAGPRLVVGYAGRPCQLPRFRLRADVRTANGHSVRRLPALGDVEPAGNIAGEQTMQVPLAPGLARCSFGRPFGLRPAEGGRAVRGTIRCRDEH